MIAVAETSRDLGRGFAAAPISLPVTIDYIPTCVVTHPMAYLFWGCFLFLRCLSGR